MVLFQSKFDKIMQGYSILILVCDICWWKYVGTGETPLKEPIWKPLRHRLSTRASPRNHFKVQPVEYCESTDPLASRLPLLVSNWIVINQSSQNHKRNIRFLDISIFGAWHERSYSLISLTQCLRHLTSTHWDSKVIMMPTLMSLGLSVTTIMTTLWF